MEISYRESYRFGAFAEFCKGRKRFAILAECATCDFRSAHLFSLNVFNRKKI